MRAMTTPTLTLSVIVFWLLFKVAMDWIASIWRTVPLPFDAGALRGVQLRRLTWCNARIELSDSAAELKQHCSWSEWLWSLAAWWEAGRRGAWQPRGWQANTARLAVKSGRGKCRTIAVARTTGPFTYLHYLRDAFYWTRGRQRSETCIASGVHGPTVSENW